jgi:hypothetical protein
MVTTPDCIAFRINKHQWLVGCPAQLLDKMVCRHEAELNLEHYHS